MNVADMTKDECIDELQRARQTFVAQDLVRRTDLIPHDWNLDVERRPISSGKMYWSAEVWRIPVTTRGNMHRVTGPDIETVILRAAVVCQRTAGLSSATEHAR